MCVGWVGRPAWLAGERLTKVTWAFWSLYVRIWIPWIWDVFGYDIVVFVTLRALVFFVFVLTTIRFENVGLLPGRHPQQLVSHPLQTWTADVQMVRPQRANV